MIPILQRAALAVLLLPFAGSFAPRSLAQAPASAFVRDIPLDGAWQAGLDRHYDRTLAVPGLAGDPGKATPGTLWYKRTVEVPVGNWTQATLTLKGARFAPQVYIDGALVSEAEGGMAPTVHRFALPAKPSFTLEIALQSMNTLSPQDASKVPGADLWRNNISSYLWDSVVLRLHGVGEIASVTPESHLAEDAVGLRWNLAGKLPSGAAVRFEILDQAGKTLVESPAYPAGDAAETLPLQGRILPWSPTQPNLYRLRAELVAGDTLLDAREQAFGQREFRVKGIGFELNREPFHMRMGTVVWHRWTRDPEAVKIAFDPVWFDRNIVQRLKAEGANALRFHLGLPPERFLDLCDREGLAVQMEWPFFHGISASSASMTVQWAEWLDVAMRHPSVVIVHPWNETGGEQLARANAVLDALLPHYAPLVVAHRDLTPVHKYWWSLFENLGLYYDSAAQFPQAVMVDEFGGDYLDENGKPSQYPSAREAFLRFLGRSNTREERLQLEADANARVGEYWRRLGVAGFSPFCILGSPEDGSNWFLGPSDVADPEPKPVWAAISALYAERSVSLEIWNRHFAPGERVPMPLWFFNDSGTPTTLHASVHVFKRGTFEGGTGEDAVPPLRVAAAAGPHSRASTRIEVAMPASDGEWTIEARLDSPLVANAPPVASSWQIRTDTPAVPPALAQKKIGVAASETELRAMLGSFGLQVVAPDDPSASLIAGSRATWKSLQQDAKLSQQFDRSLHRGTSIVLLDVGPEPLGVGYATTGPVGGPLEGAPTIATPKLLEVAHLFGGVTVAFPEMAEPESTIQTAREDQTLFDHVPRGGTWLWNGLRGGLIVPAADMQVSGLSGAATLATWRDRGADPAQIAAGHAFAYELAGYYAFAPTGDDKEASGKLRLKVKSMVEDAPALQSVVNPNAPIAVTDLGAAYRAAGRDAEAQTLTPLANAGKNLTRIPAVRLAFGPASGSLTLSQLLTAGRLIPGASQPGPGVYGLRYDPIAVQFVLNMLASALPPPAR